MMAAKISSILRRLEQHYGEPLPPPVSGPYEMVLWEIVAYLADDSVRLSAFQQLRDRTGLDPARILAAPKVLLTGIARAGGSIAAEERAQRVQIASKLVIDDFGGDLSSVLKLPLQKAKKLLMRFPIIGEPGAEKILLFCGVLPVLALESNGVHVLVRLGVAEELKSYAATYKALRQKTLELLPQDCGFLMKAHLILKQHGRQLCFRNGPACHACPVRTECRYYQTRN